MLTRMAETPKRNLPRNPSSGESTARTNGQASILADLPRTRPQRPSARRAATQREMKNRRSENVLAGLPRARPQHASPRRAAARKARAHERAGGRASEHQSSLRSQQVPRQGFEAEPDELMGSVQPPGSADLIASAGELAGELAKTGIATGTRLLRDFLSRLPG
jgi:hypothetical protein